MRLIDADKLFPYGAVPFYQDDGFKTADRIYGIINDAPTVDAVEVVRCKDCKWFREYTEEYKQNVEKADGDCYHRMLNSENEQFWACCYDDYCSFGGRKNDGTL